MDDAVDQALALAIAQPTMLHAAGPGMRGPGTAVGLSAAELRVLQLLAAGRGKGAGGGGRWRTVPQHGPGAAGARHPRRPVPSPAAQAPAPLLRPPGTRPGAGGLRGPAGCTDRLHTRGTLN